MNSTRKIFQWAIVLVALFTFACGQSDEAFQAQLSEDAKNYADMKCELLMQVRAIKADTTIANQQAMIDSLKKVWNEKAGPLQEKYDDTPEHQKLFREKAKEYQGQIEGCEKLEEGGKHKEKKEAKNED